MMQLGSEISLSPSFNGYTNTDLAEIAARVVEEFDSESEEYCDEFYFERGEDSTSARNREDEKPENNGGGSEICDIRRNDVVEDEKPENNGGGGEICDIRGNDVVEDGGEFEFEFAFVPRGDDLFSPISADEIFHNGQIRPVYPVFNRNVFLESMDKEEKKCASATIRLPLRKLFIEERETSITAATTSSSSSSDADELEGVPADTYCVWRPKDSSEERCKKSGSAGSNSKRWKFRDLMHRSNSDGSKDSFVFLGDSNNSGRKKQNGETVKATAPSAGKLKSTAEPPTTKMMAAYNRDGGEKRRSYLPYRPDLVGFFTKN